MNVYKALVSAWGMLKKSVMGTQMHVLYVCNIFLYFDCNNITESPLVATRILHITIILLLLQYSSTGIPSNTCVEVLTLLSILPYPNQCYTMIETSTDTFQCCLLAI